MTDAGVPPPGGGGDPAAALPAGLDPMALVRTKSYVVLLVLGAIIGLPIAVVSYFFLKAVSNVSEWIFTTLPKDLFTDVPVWWPLVPLAIAGLLVGLAITYLPGDGGHEPANGFVATG